MRVNSSRLLATGRFPLPPLREPDQGLGLVLELVLGLVGMMSGPGRAMTGRTGTAVSVSAEAPDAVFWACRGVGACRRACTGAGACRIAGGGLCLPDWRRGLGSLPDRMNRHRRRLD